MKTNLRWITATAASLVLAILSLGAHAIPIVSDGSDGAFHPTASQTLNLDTLAPDGIFNFTTIEIPENVTIRFTRNSLNTPVLLAATGNVVIRGTIDVSAGHFSGRAGPGGGDGGAAGVALGGGSDGAGPSPGAGGAPPLLPGNVLGQAGGGGGMATPGLTATSRSFMPPAAAGDATVLSQPVITGGSGGGGGGAGRFVGISMDGGVGGGGGGGLQISTPGDLLLEGSLLADGGHAGWAFANIFAHGGPGGGGSGGNFELNAASITLSDTALISAIGGAGGGLSTETVPFDPFFHSSGAHGGQGYALFDTANLNIDPLASLEVTVVTPGDPGSSPDDPLLPGNDTPPWIFERVPVGDTGAGRDAPLWFDPVVAVGYEYEVLAGPNIASLLLPTGFGDDLYDLLLINPGTGDYEFVQSVLAGTTLDLTGLSAFGTSFAGGVDRMRILGIETSAGVDPADPLAFPTGLTFVSAGDVTLRMTPIGETLQAMPAPPTPALLALALVALARRRRG